MAARPVETKESAELDEESKYIPITLWHRCPVRQGGLGFTDAASLNYNDVCDMCRDVVHAIVPKPVAINFTFRALPAKK